MKFATSWMAAAGLAAMVACGGDGEKDQPAAPKTTPAPTSAPTPQPSRGSLSGRLTDKATSLALANVTVFAQPAERGSVLAQGALASTVTRGDGTFTLQGLPLGEPLCVATQAVTGAVHYQTAVTAPITLAAGKEPDKINLAVASVPLGGAVEGQAPTKRDPAFSKATVTLIHSVPASGGKDLYAVVRATVHEQGAFRFETLEPGIYYVMYNLTGSVTKPIRSGFDHSSHNLTWVSPVQVKAGETAHVAWPKAKAPGAAQAAPH